VLDLANEAAAIKAAFEPYYEMTQLQKRPIPNYLTKFRLGWSTSLVSIAGAIDVGVAQPVAESTRKLETAAAIAASLRSAR
jgi:hypothetical protein